MLLKRVVVVYLFLLSTGNEIFSSISTIGSIFKEHYFLVFPLTPRSYNELCVTPSSFSAPSSSQQRRPFWSSDRFSQKAKNYSIPYKAFTDEEKAMKEILHSFSRYC